MFVLSTLCTKKWQQSLPKPGIILRSVFNCFHRHHCAYKHHGSTFHEPHLRFRFNTPKPQENAPVSQLGSTNKILRKQCRAFKMFHLYTSKANSANCNEFPCNFKKEVKFVPGSFRIFSQSHLAIAKAHLLAATEGIRSCNCWLQALAETEILKAIPLMAPSESLDWNLERTMVPASTSRMVYNLQAFLDD